MKNKSLISAFPLNQALLEFDVATELKQSPEPDLSYFNGSISTNNRGMLEVHWNRADCEAQATQVRLIDQRTNATVYEEELSRGHCVISGLLLNRDYRLAIRAKSTELMAASAWVHCSIRIG